MGPLAFWRSRVDRPSLIPFNFSEKNFAFIFIVIMTYLWSEVGENQWVHYSQLRQDFWSEWETFIGSYNISCHFTISAITESVTWTQAEMKHIAAQATDIGTTMPAEWVQGVTIKPHLNVDNALPWYLKGEKGYISTVTRTFTEFSMSCHCCCIATNAKSNVSTSCSKQAEGCSELRKHMMFMGYGIHAKFKIHSNLL